MTHVEARPWTVRKVDGWWCVYLSDGQLGAKFIREGDARTFARLAGPGAMDDLPAGLDLDMVADEIANLFDRFEEYFHLPEVMPEQVRPHLPAFLAAVLTALPIESLRP